MKPEQSIEERIEQWMQWWRGTLTGETSVHEDIAMDIIYDLFAERNAALEKLEDIKEAIEGDFMLDGKWVDDPSTLIKYIHEWVSTTQPVTAGE